MLHRAASAGNFHVAYPAANTRRTSSPAIPPSLGTGGASLMPHRKPDFSEGSHLEERDPRTQRTLTRYRVGPLLGQGGFAKCYDVKDLETGAHWALKVCERQKLIQTKTLNKLQTEIAIHRRMHHKNIVKFQKTFQDEWNIYIVLELCTGGTLMDLSKRRKRFTLQETQHVMVQLLMCCQYMHENNVIHRDLKLGNMMLDGDLNLKLGDFGLAAELLYDGERKRTICGTPNYIAPEILQAGRDGHSFEVDTWSIGVILYTMLVGEPPFQTSDVKATYSRIKQCRYTFPPGLELSSASKDLIYRILQSNPNSRPTLMDIRDDPFFKAPLPPREAPLSMFPSHLRGQKEAQRASAVASSANVASNTNAAASASNSKAVTAAASCGGADNNKQQQPPLSGREALRPVFNGVPSAWPTGSNNANNNNNNGANSARPSTSAGTTNAAAVAAPAPTTRAPPMPQRPVTSARASLASASSADAAPAPSSSDAVVAAAPSESKHKMDDEERDHLAAAHDELHRTLIGADGAAPATTTTSSSAANRPETYPGCTPPAVWVTDYADFSSRYGLSYRLSTGHTGVHYNDNTKLVWEPVSSRAEYYTRVKDTAANGQQVVSDQRSAFLMEAAPESLNKKTTLIKYFRSYIKAGGKRDSAEVVKCSAVPSASITAKPLTDAHMTSDMIYVKRWMLTSNAMVFRLSNRVIQVCFFDKSEVILASESKIVTFTEPTTGARRTMPLTAVNAEGGELAQKLMFTKDILSRLIANRDI